MFALIVVCPKKDGKGIGAKVTPKKTAKSIAARPALKAGSVLAGHKTGTVYRLENSNFLVFQRVDL
jgi:hypothetical protein